MSRLLKFVPPLLVSIGGVAAAILWFYVWKPLAFLPSVVALLLGFGLDRVAQRKLDADDPVAATKWIYGWAFVPFAIAVAAAGAVIIVAVRLDPGDKPPVERKEVFSAAATAIGTFLVAMFVKGADEADETWVGARFKKKFQARFRGRFPRQAGQAASLGEVAVESEQDLGFQGWGAAARKQRAQIVAEELR